MISFCKMIKNVDDDNDMTTYLMKRVIYEATAAEAATSSAAVEIT